LGSRLIDNPAIIIPLTTAPAIPILEWVISVSADELRLGPKVVDIALGNAENLPGREHVGIWLEEALGKWHVV